MNLIDQKFAELKAQKRTALLPFVSVGDPDIATTVDILATLQDAGADIIELGVPYSDPLADGPVIQRASQRALQHKLTIVDCIEVASAARARGVTLPFVLFSYYNPVLQLGIERFFQLLQAHDISGALIPDLPLEESDEVVRLSKTYHIHLIPLVAPTSAARIERITAQAAGFIYCVSSLGVTGERAEFHEGIDRFIATVKASTPLPIALGFGISTPEQFRRFSTQCDGIIVGSSIIRQIEDRLAMLQSSETREKALLQIGEFVRELKGEAKLTD